MEPLHHEGDSILVDWQRRDRAEHRIYVVRTGDGLVVKPVGRAADGARLLVSEHPSWAPIAWPGGADTISRAVWMIRFLVLTGKCEAAESGSY